MWDWIKGQLSSIITATGEAIDRNVTNDEERIKAKTEAARMQNEFIARIEDQALKFESEVTDRWKTDSLSDNWLSKSTRPIIALTTFFMFVICVILDSADFGFKVRDAWIEVIESVLITVIVAYFGSRGLEKINLRKKK